MDSMNTNYHNAFENATKNNEFSRDLFKTTKKSHGKTPTAKHGKLFQCRVKLKGQNQLQSLK